jgi:hypothetical protein
MIDMSMIQEGFRHFWLRDIHRISGVTREGLAAWIVHGDFVVTSAKARDDFIIRVLVPEGARKGLAHDSTRMASAAFETMLGIDAVRNLPKSTGWVVIRAYYAAFFAAHSLLRMFGTSCLQVELPQINILDRTATICGCLPVHGFESGFYIACYDGLADEIRFHKSASARRGSHEVLWEVFASKVREVSNHLLTISSKFTQLSLQLSEIENLLRQDGLTSGTWLSHIRNLANYRHEFGLWFPYSGSVIPAADLVKITRKWNGDPNRLLSVRKGDRITLHVWLCTVIVAICHAVACDMEEHGFRRKSFHSYGSLALARMADQRGGRVK